MRRQRALKQCARERGRKGGRNQQPAGGTAALALGVTTDGAVTAHYDYDASGNRVGGFNQRCA